MIKIQEWYLGLWTLESQKHLLCFILLNNTSIAFIRIMKTDFKATLSVSWIYHLEIISLQSEISGRLLPTKDNKTF